MQPGTLYSALFLTVPLMITGCSSSGSTDVNENTDANELNDVVDVSFWYALSGTLEQTLLNQVSDFNASQNGIRVVPDYKGNYDEVLQAGLDALDQGNPPALLQVYEVGTATLAKRTNDYIPVQELLKQNGSDPGNDYLPLVTSYFSDSSGRLLSLPYNVSTPVLFTNDDALSRAGIDDSIATRTWNDIEAILQTLKDQGQDCPFTTSWPSWIHVETYSARHDLPFASSGNGFDSETVDLLFNNETQISHVQRLQDWSEQSLFIYKGQQNSGGAPFRAGECLLLTESSASRAGTESSVDFSFSVRPLPYDDVNGAPRNTIIGGASLWALGGQTDDTYTAVAEFLTYLSSPSVQASWHQQTGYLPITQSAYELSKNQGYYDRVPDAEIPVLQMLQGTPTTNTRGIRLNNFVEIRETIDDELMLAWEERSKSAAEALNDAIVRSEIYLDVP